MFKRLKFALEGRSPQWAKVRKDFLDSNPYCEACGTKYSLEVHHIVPFHVDMSLELDQKNLMTLCKSCHLVLGHLRNYEIYNVHVHMLIDYFKSLRCSSTSS